MALTAEAFEEGQRGFVPNEDVQVPEKYQEVCWAYMSGWRWARDCALHFM